MPRPYHVKTQGNGGLLKVGLGARLAFGLMGLLVVLAGWATQAQAAEQHGYALYLFQAAGLHGYRYFTDEKRSAARLWRSFIATLLYAGMMTFFAIYALLR
jgi:1,4-dihydroxy-2-naphthoate octaprenyltransferase